MFCLKDIIFYNNLGVIEVKKGKDCKKCFGYDKEKREHRYYFFIS